MIIGYHIYKIVLLDALYFLVVEEVSRDVAMMRKLGNNRFSCIEIILHVGLLFIILAYYFGILYWK